MLTPQLYHTWTCHLTTFSCSTFFRRSVVKEGGFMLDPRWKVVGDADLIIRMLRGGVRMDILRRYTSTFVDNGENLSLQSRGGQERVALMGEAPHWANKVRSGWSSCIDCGGGGMGVYSLKPFAYDIYTQESPGKRVHFEVAKPTFYWTSRMK